MADKKRPVVVELQADLERFIDGMTKAQGGK